LNSISPIIFSISKTEKQRDFTLKLVFDVFVRKTLLSYIRNNSRNNSYFETAFEGVASGVAKSFKPAGKGQT
jgi:hypothetical protein